MNRVARRALRRAFFVLPVSEAMRHALAAPGVQARFRVVPNAFDERVFHPGPPRTPDGTRRLLTAGLLSENQAKGVDHLLAAFALVTRGSDVRLDVVGDGPRRRE